MTELDVRSPPAALRTRRPLPGRLRPRAADRCAGHRPPAGRAARARRRAGLRVATFVSGYQGSPLGGLDQMLAGMPTCCTKHDITFVPGLNEELAATSVWGSQVDLPQARGPTTASSASGTARAPDSTARATPSGTPTCTAPTPAAACWCSSATTPPPSPRPSPPSASGPWPRFGMPVLFPRNASEIVTFGLYGSRDVAGLRLLVGAEDRRRRRRRRLDARPRRRRPRHRRPASRVGRPAVVYRQRPMAAPADSVDRRGRPVRPALGDGRSAFNAANDLDAIEVDPRTRRWASSPSGPPTTRCARR